MHRIRQKWARPVRNSLPEAGDGLARRHDTLRDCSLVYSSSPQPHVLVVVAKVLALSLTIGRVFACLGASTAPYMTWITDADTVQWHMIWIEHGQIRKTEMDGSGTAIALDRNDGATRTHQDAVDSDCSVLTRTEFDEVTDAQAAAPLRIMTWVIDGYTVQWFVIGSDGRMIWI
jgi:hypothetical protein